MLTFPRFADVLFRNVGGASVPRLLFESGRCRLRRASAFGTPVRQDGEPRRSLPHYFRVVERAYMVILCATKNWQLEIGNWQFQNAPLAQLVEQVTLNHWVVGSIPTRCTNAAGGRSYRLSDGVLIQSHSQTTRKPRSLLAKLGTFDPRTVVRRLLKRDFQLPPR